MWTPAAKRDAVAHLSKAHEMSESAGVPGGGLRSDDGAVSLAATGRSEVARKAAGIAHERRRFGYRRLLIFLRREVSW